MEKIKFIPGEEITILQGMSDNFVKRLNIIVEKVNEIVEWINTTQIEKRVDRLEGIEN